MGSNYALQFASPRVASFIAGLFMEVAEAAALELCGWVPSFPEFAYASPTCLNLQNSQSIIHALVICGFCFFFLSGLVVCFDHLADLTHGNDLK